MVGSQHRIGSDLPEEYYKGHDENIVVFRVYLNYGMFGFQPMVPQDPKCINSKQTARPD